MPLSDGLGCPMLLIFDNGKRNKENKKKVNEEKMRIRKWEQSCVFYLVILFFLPTLYLVQLIFVSCHISSPLVSLHRLSMYLIM